MAARSATSQSRSPAAILRRETAALPDAVPLWGQKGSFVIAVAGAGVRIAMAGIFSISASTDFWPGFSAQAVDWDQPFISETGYRSFLGIHAEPVAGLTPDAFAAEVITAHVRGALKGRLVAIEPRYRKLAA